MGRDAAHRVHRHRPARERLVPLPVHVGPGLLDPDRPLERHMRELAGQPPDGGGRHPAALGHALRRVSPVQIPRRQPLEDRNAFAPVRQSMPPQHAAGRQRGSFRVAGVEAVVRLSRCVDR